MNRRSSDERLEDEFRPRRSDERLEDEFIMKVVSMFQPFSTEPVAVSVETPGGVIEAEGVEKEMGVKEVEDRKGSGSRGLQYQEQRTNEYNALIKENSSLFFSLAQKFA